MGSEIMLLQRRLEECQNCADEKEGTYQTPDGQVKRWICPVCNPKGWTGPMCSTCGKTESEHHWDEEQMICPDTLPTRLNSDGGLQ